jgi:hypothetical protein
LAIALLRAGNGPHFGCAVCLDSGADACVFPSTFAAALGLDTLTMPKHLTAGVGSSANVTWSHDLNIDLGNGIRFNSKVGFMPALDIQGMGLLGQCGFFEYYRVEFRHAERRFTVEIT